MAHNVSPTRHRLHWAFRLFGFGALVLAGTLMGRVSADQTTGTTDWHTIFMISAGVGLLFILAGLAILLVNLPHLLATKGE